MKNEKKQYIIAGVDRYRVAEPLFESVRVVLSHRKKTYSPAYIQGISGAAFRIAGICPCAPTCNCMMDTLDLPRCSDTNRRHCRFTLRGLIPGRLQEVATILKSEIKGDRPVLLWNAFTFNEWDVVCGFDTAKNQLFGRGSYVGLDDGQYASADESRVLTADARMHYEAILIGEKTGTFDAEKAELAALIEAVHHAKSRQNKDECGGGKWAMFEGLLCYDRWVEDFRSNPSKEPDIGDTYCLGVYSSTHQAAGQFLREIAPKYPEAGRNLNRAAEHFAAEAESLGKCYAMNRPNGNEVKNSGPDLNKVVSDLLGQAREQYACGINDIETALQLID